MKKIICTLCVIIPLIIFIIIMSLQYITPKSNEKLILNYLSTAFTVDDYTKINYSTKMIKEKDKTLKQYTLNNESDKYIDEFYTLLLENKLNSKIDKIDITKISKRTNGNIVYSYTINLKLQNTQKNQLVNVPISGKLSLKRDNFKWKVSEQIYSLGNIWKRDY